MTDSPDKNGGVDHARIEAAVREILLAVGEDHVGPTPGEFPGEGFPDSGGASGHQADRVAVAAEHARVLHQIEEASQRRPTRFGPGPGGCAEIRGREP